MLCLTVYECKGLEFDEVILFNFFQDSKCVNQWKLLNDVIASEKIVKKGKAGGADFLDFEMLEASEATEITDQQSANQSQVMIDTTDSASQTAQNDGQVASRRL